eukprot:10453412-Lingulodinium_polyedra.AAC.1
MASNICVPPVWSTRARLHPTAIMPSTSLANKCALYASCCLHGSGLNLRVMSVCTRPARRWAK